MTPDKKAKTDAISRAVTKASDAYSDHPELRVAFGAIPVIGSALDIIVSEPGRRAKEKRVEDFLKEAGEELAALGRNKVDKDFLKGPEFEGAVAKIVATVAVTSNEKKLRQLRDAFKGVIRQGRQGDPLRQSMLDMVTTLSPEHVDLLSTVRSVVGTKRAKSEAAKRPPRPVSYDPLKPYATAPAGIPLTETIVGQSIGTTSIVTRQRREIFGAEISELEVKESPTPEPNQPALLADLVARGLIEVVRLDDGETPKSYASTALGDALVELLESGRRSY